ncbi:MAG: prolyl oligopeptidase family serine peptidase [Acidobacteria bacterium]|nr:prolyl oligopeptidase family serine peptidase [Acidobacteriota bacterium]
MRTRLSHVGLVGLLLLLGAREASAEIMRWQIDGENRKAIVYAPEDAKGERGVPVVLSFHGRGDDMVNFQYTDVHKAWPEAIVVYFQGLSTGGGLPGWQSGRGADNDRDLKLVDAALATLRETYNVDEDRTYATGFSNGGMFTYLLWAERPGLFAAYAPVAGRLRPSVEPTQRKPIFHVAGRRDRQVDFSEQRAAIRFAVDVNGVSGTTTSCGEGCTLYGADTTTPVMTWIHPGAHVYPRDTSERIVAFFRDHPRTP